MPERLPIEHVRVRLIVKTGDRVDELDLEDAIVKTETGLWDGDRFTPDSQFGPGIPATRRTITAITIDRVPIRDIQPVLHRWDPRWRPPMIEGTCPSCGRRLVRQATGWAMNDDGLTARFVCDRSQRPAKCWRVFDAKIPMPELEAATR